MRMTAKQANMVDRYNTANYTSVLNAYCRPSTAKIEAERQILAEMVSNGGSGYRVTGANSCFFTCAYTYKKDGKTRLVYHTHANKFDFEIE